MRIILVAALVMFACSVAGASPTHERLAAKHGVMHAWTPSNYDAASAGIVVYVHGFYTDVDSAWRDHRLPEQFAASGINAVFIACAAPSNSGAPVSWSDLGALLAAAERAIPGGLPRGRLVVVGHSGAHRTLGKWLTNKRISTLVLVDAVYADAIPHYKAWIDGAPGRRMLSTAVNTQEQTERLHAMLPDTLAFDAFPTAREGEIAGAADARVVYVRSQHDHMSLVTNGVALPMLLRATRLPSVAATPRNAPIATRD